VRLGLVKYVAGVPYAEATRVLARLILFSAEDEVRQAAIDALNVRRERDYTAVLLQGFRYPWPAVARRAADALVKLDHRELVPRLVELLDEPDPRAPVVQKVNGKRVPVVRELVRVNHHRNCLLCHPPASSGPAIPEALAFNGRSLSETLTAPIPVPSEPLPSPSEGYQNASPDVLVRLDATYLRQDFSVLQPVADAHPWPEMQRFDFLVRTRALTDEEAEVWRTQFAQGERKQPSPYRRAAVTALRELTGLDAAPTAEAWRRVLKRPEMPLRTAFAQ
jgi:hypothetical protein